MRRCADQITLKLLRTRRFERGNVASLEAAKAVFRAAWDRRPTHKKNETANRGDTGRSRTSRDKGRGIRGLGRPYPVALI